MDYEAFKDLKSFHEGGGDNVGVTVTSHKKLSLNVGGVIEMNKLRYINATSQLQMTKEIHQMEF